MLPDVLSVVVRALSFIAGLQATGGVLFLTLFGRGLSGSIPSIVRIVRAAALAGMSSLIFHTWLEAARMSGALSGLFDPTLIGPLLHSTTTGVLGVRLLSLMLVLVAVRRRDAFHAAAGVLGATLFAASFALTGHTTAHLERWLLGPTLILHLLIVTFWFGALLPLYLVSRAEGMSISARIVEQFSAWAIWTVPVIFAAGLLLLLRLLSGVDALFTPYGLLLLGKIAGFSLLMCLAALNKWRLGPALATDGHAMRAFRRSLLIEFILICMVLSATTVMTTFFSPEG